ncbi:MAG: molybdenum cofactor guanylyltransferase [Methanobacteriaceae archaeon]|nr:molybdenum cofactor guanylyltransferase [Methanobacteriaceae archaeon]
MIKISKKPLKSCIVLCGGMSTRMGRDKGSMILNDEPIIYTVLKNLDSHVDEVFLVLRDQNQVNYYKKLLNSYLSDDYLDFRFAFNFNLKFLIDDIMGQGPLAGIMIGLSVIMGEYALVLPCDSPYVSSDFIDNMFNEMEALSEFDALIPQWENGDLEPLHAIYHINSRNIINQMFLTEKRDVKSLINKINSHFIKVSKLDSSLKSYKNINCPDDLLK